MKDNLCTCREHKFVPSTEKRAINLLTIVVDSDISLGLNDLRYIICLYGCSARSVRDNTVSLTEK